MKRHRWYVGLIDKAGQDVDSEIYHRTLGAIVSSYTAYKAEGAWQGTREPSLVFEVFDDYLPLPRKWVASELKRAGNQECVLYVIDTCDVTFC